MDIVTEIKETRKDKSLSTSFSMSKSPETKKIKKHISSMLGFQAKSAKNNAAKDELSLLQMKLAAAKDNLANATDSDDQNKYNTMVKKLQGKLNKLLEESDESDESNTN